MRRTNLILRSALGPILALVVLVAIGTTVATWSLAGEQRQAVLTSVVLSNVAPMMAFWLVAETRLRREQEHDRSERRALNGRRLEALLDDSPDSAFVIDPRGRIIYRSESGDRLLASGSRRLGDLVALADPVKQSSLRDDL